MREDFNRLIVSVFCSFLGLTLLILLMSCGGSGGDSTPTPTPAPTPTTIIDKSVVPLLHDRNIGAYGAEEFKPAEKGQRHTRLVSIIGIELSRSFIEENTLAICLEWNKKNKPPMTEAEVVNTVHDVYQRYDHYEEKKI